MTTINSTLSGLTTGIVAAVFSLACAVLLAIAPQATLSLFGNIFHGIDLTQITKAVSWGGIIIGLIEIFIIGFVAGWLFAKIYNKLDN